MEAVYRQRVIIYPDGTVLRPCTSKTWRSFLKATLTLAVNPAGGVLRFLFWRPTRISFRSESGAAVRTHGFTRLRLRTAVAGPGCFNEDMSPHISAFGSK